MNVSATGAALLRNRRFVRAPIWLFRARLGIVFGSRLLLLEHIGRTSGARRYVVLEVVARRGPAMFVVASGFGTRAQWFRNVEANPQVRVWFRSRPPVAGTARVLTQEEGTAILTAYAEAHPRTWRRFKPVFEKTLGAPIDVHAPTMPLVALDTGPR